MLGRGLVGVLGVGVRFPRYRLWVGEGEMGEVLLQRAGGMRVRSVERRRSGSRVLSSVRGRCCGRGLFCSVRRGVRFFR